MSRPRAASRALLVASLVLGATATSAHPVRVHLTAERPPARRPEPSIELAREPPPPPPKPPAPARPWPIALGLRYGVWTPRPTAGFGMGFDAGLILDPRLRLVAEYEYLFRTAMDASKPDDEVHGRGHRLRVGARLGLGSATIGKVVRLYADLDGGVGVASVAERGHARRLVQEQAIGLRLGYELLGREPSTDGYLDWHVSVRAGHAEGDWGLGFTVGFEWGPRRARAPSS